MSKKQNGRAADKSANTNSKPAATETVNQTEREQLEIETLDTGANDRISRWRKYAETYASKIERKEAFDEIRVMAEKHGMSMIDWVLEYLKETRLNVEPSDGCIIGTRHNRWIDWLYDSDSKQARTAHEREQVRYAFFHLGMNFNNDLSVDDMRILAANFATEEDWNLSPARDCAVKFAIVHCRTKKVSG